MTNSNMASVSLSKWKNFEVYPEWACPMNVLSSFEHNIRVILLVGSGPGDVAQELGELRYHIGIMCMLMLLFHSLFLVFLFQYFVS